MFRLPERHHPSTTSYCSVSSSQRQLAPHATYFILRVLLGWRSGQSCCGSASCIARLREPHQCPCSAEVDPEGSRGIACRRSAGRMNDLLWRALGRANNTAKSARHQAINGVIYRAFASAQVTGAKEPAALSCSDGRRPDGMTLIPWQNDKALTCDVTVATTVADFYISASARSTDAAAELVVMRKITKYYNLPAAYICSSQSRWSRWEHRSRIRILRILKFIINHEF